MGQYFIDGAALAPRTIQLTPWVIDYLPAIITFFLLYYGVTRAKALHTELSIYVLCAVITFFMIIASRSSWAPHHFVYALLFLILALGKMLEAVASQKIVLTALVAAVVLYGVTLAWRLPTATISLDTNQAKDQLLRYVRDSHLDRSTVQMHVGWGTYYIASLFGHRDRAVLWSFIFLQSPDQIDQTYQLAKALGRGVLIVTSNAQEVKNASLIQSKLGDPLQEYRFENWSALRYVR